MSVCVCVTVCVCVCCCTWTDECMSEYLAIAKYVVSQQESSVCQHYAAWGVWAKACRETLAESKIRRTQWKKEEEGRKNVQVHKRSVWVMENERRGKRKKEISVGMIGREMGGLAHLCGSWYLQWAALGLSRPQRQTEGWMEGKKNTGGSGWQISWAAWLAVRHLPLTHQPPATLSLSVQWGRSGFGQEGKLLRKKGVGRKQQGFQVMMCED